MARPTAARNAWIAASAAAGLLLLGLALFGPERGGSLQGHEAGGTMAAIALEQIQRIEVRAGPRQWLIEHRAGSWVSEPAWPQGADAQARLVRALTVLRNAVPERQFEHATPEFGLDAPALQLRVFTAAGDEPAYAVDIGALNPIGLAHYARVRRAGQVQLVLLPAYAADEWRPLLGLP